MSAHGQAHMDRQFPDGLGSEENASTRYLLWNVAWPKALFGIAWRRERTSMWPGHSQMKLAHQSQLHKNFLLPWKSWDNFEAPNVLRSFWVEEGSLKPRYFK